MKQQACLQTHTTLTNLCILAICLVLSACGGGGGSSGGNSNLFGGGLNLGDVMPVTFGSDGTANINFEQAPDSATEFAFLIVGGEALNGSVPVGLKSSLSSQQLIAAPVDFLEETPQTENPQDFLEEVLRVEEEFIAENLRHSLSRHALVAGGEPGSGLDISQGGSPTPCAGGSGIEFSVLASLSGNSFTTVCGILKHQSTTVNYYLDEEADGYSFTDADITTIVNDFEAKLPGLRNIFGQESDVNSDSRVAILLTSGVNKLTQSLPGSIITGYFHSIDVIDGLNNDMDMFYVSVPDPSGVFGTTISKSFWLSNFIDVLAHEFQHLVSFNQHVILRGGSAEVSTFNEFYSHIAENYHPQTSLSEPGIEHPSRIKLFLDGPYIDITTGSTDLRRRGGGTLFMQYLCDQADRGLLTNSEVQNCEDMLRRLVQTNRTSIENVLHVTGAESFQDLLVPFYAAVQIENRCLKAANPVYTFQNFELCEGFTHNDNRGTKMGQVKSLPLAGSATLKRLESVYLTEKGSNIGSGIALQASPQAAGALIRIE